MRKRPTRRHRHRSRSQVCSREEQLHVTLEPRHRDRPTVPIWNSTSIGKARHAMIFCVNKAFLVKINKALCEECERRQRVFVAVSSHSLGSAAFVEKLWEALQKEIKVLGWAKGVICAIVKHIWCWRLINRNKWVPVISFTIGWNAKLQQF